MLTLMLWRNSVGWGVFGIMVDHHVLVVDIKAGEILFNPCHWPLGTFFLFFGLGFTWRRSWRGWWSWWGWRRWRL